MRLWSFTQDPAAIADYGPLETMAGKQFDIESIRAAKDHFVVRIAGINDRDEAAKLCNLDLYVPRDRLPPIAEDDTYYQADLIGLAAGLALPS
ncbi:MAG: 16S rRNA processing protein RimM, partial [Rhizobiales bacterium 35-68-8]